MVHIVAAEGGEFDAADRLGGRTPRLGVLPREPPDARDPLSGSMHEHEAHLKEDLELGSDRGRTAVGEALGAVAAPEDEAFTTGRLGDLRLQRLDLVAGDERRKGGELAEDAVERGSVGIDRLLGAGKGAPALGSPCGVDR